MASTCQPKCHDGFYADSNRVCQTCPSKCKTCKDENSCLSCVAPLRLGLDYQCVESCNFGEYVNIVSADQYECTKCSDNCETCDKDAYSCLTCRQGTFLSSSQCASKCPSGMFSNPSTRKCQSCSLSCR
jgi:proprotein convertase subtilisin/kexin type 5